MTASGLVLRCHRRQLVWHLEHGVHRERGELHRRVQARPEPPYPLFFCTKACKRSMAADVGVEHLQRLQGVRHGVSRTCTCALVVGALVKDIGEEGPWKDIPVRRYTFSWVHDTTPAHSRPRRYCGKPRYGAGAGTAPVQAQRAHTPALAGAAESRGRPAS